MFKKFLVTALIATSMFAAIPAQKAEAGLIFGCVVDKNHNGGTSLAGFLVVSSVAYIFGAGLGWAIVLDEKGEISQDQLAGNLAMKYPFIDNADVTAELANTIKLKYAEEKNTQENVLVSLSENETRSILSQADLSDEEVEQVVNDLK